MKTLYSGILCICWSCYAFSAAAQAPGLFFRITDSFALKARQVYTDPSGNLYWINQQGVFFKKDGQADSLYQYTNWSTGIPDQADVSNPLRILLFYAHTGRIYFLSRWLTSQYVLDLKAKGILQPAAMALSYDNQIWVYDAGNGTLKKISPDGNLLLQSAPFNQLMPGLLQPTRIIDRHQQVYLYDPQRGIAVYDELANFKTWIPVENSQSFAVTDEWLYVLKADSLYVFQPPFRQWPGISLPAYIKLRDIAVSPNNHRLWVLGTRALYTLQLSIVSNN
ncbi:NHL repeat-containing protein [Thermoflavifilum thermophilum]|uniref:NHL repeat-containing protein n=1 Tax=Thermoflavifilum thermophilum TaxID=1393122 RepID=A0A1I7NBS5_9BACT|nr:hypothetical protein [Thermoflavifilum thermophilum]SFV32115.1 hypothetical protein SAMN05660895_1250 [Thermoflavifilum thermophilum]